MVSEDWRQRFDELRRWIYSQYQREGLLGNQSRHIKIISTTTMSAPRDYQPVTNYWDNNDNKQHKSTNERTNERMTTRVRRVVCGLHQYQLEYNLRLLCCCHRPLNLLHSLLSIAHLARR